ncbi:MAG: alkanesulfonate monooxygenase SsuD, partial [Gammaproteobacteria bacterium]
MSLNRYIVTFKKKERLDMKFGMVVNTQSPPDSSGMAQLYEEILAESELADAVGFDGVYVPEHHMKPDGYLPAPMVLLAAIAARTKKVRVGTAIMHLPQWHPIHVAEEIAVLDNISRGRATLGVGLNLVDDEMALFGITRENVVTRFTESIDILRKSWGEKNFSYDGKIYQLNDVTITPRIVQDEIPLWIGAMSEPAVKRAGQLGTGFVTDPLHKGSVIKVWADLYRDTAKAHGFGDKAEVILGRDGWVTNNPKELRESWWPTILDYHLFYKNLGFFTSGRFNSDMEPWVLTATNEDWTYDNVVPDRIIAGTPEQVIAEIEYYRDEIGVDQILFALRHASGPSHEETMA